LKEISKEDLDLILECSIRAGNSGNRQVYSIIVVKDPVLLKKYYYSANRALVFLVDFNRWVDLAKHLNFDIESSIDGLRGFTMSSMDAMLAAQNAALAAKSLGIDSLFTSSLHRGDLDEIYQEFNLPDKFCFPYLSLALGYSDESPEPLKGRVSKGVIHSDKYSPLTDEELDAQIMEYDDPENHMSFVTPEQVQKAGFKHALGYYFGKWAISEPKEKIQAFYQRLEKSGFLRKNDFIV
jgi:nitroreductase